MIQNHFGKVIAVGGAVSMLAGAAYGSDQSQGQNGKTRLSLDDLRAKCESVLNNPQMIKPVVPITCEEDRYYWKKCPAEFDLDESRVIKTTIGVKSWYSDSNGGLNAAQTMPCASFAQYILQVPAVHSEVKCDYVLDNFITEEDLNEYCEGQINNYIGKYKALWDDAQQTGEVFDTCAGKMKQGQDQGQQDACSAPGKLGPGQQAQDGDQGQQGDSSQDY